MPQNYNCSRRGERTISDGLFSKCDLVGMILKLSKSLLHPWTCSSWYDFFSFSNCIWQMKTHHPHISKRKKEIKLGNKMAKWSWAVNPGIFRPNIFQPSVFKHKFWKNLSTQCFQREICNHFSAQYFQTQIWQEFINPIFFKEKFATHYSAQYFQTQILQASTNPILSKRNLQPFFCPIFSKKNVHAFCSPIFSTRKYGSNFSPLNKNYPKQKTLIFPKFFPTISPISPPFFPHFFHFFYWE